MKRIVSASFCLVIVSSAISACAQVGPAAYRRGLSIHAGAEASVFQPDYAGNGIAQTSPNRLYGVGALVDVHLTRWIQIEGEGRWLRFNEFQNIGMNTYMIGPKVPIIDFHRWTPYGKFLIGMGGGSGGWLSGNATAFAYGGGVEYQWTRKLTIRAFDFEEQDWHTTPALHPYGASAGITYRVFGGRAQ
ncbi:MAG: outer membrane beta-barrel protein [Terracidiphilus sp.]